MLNVRSQKTMNKKCDFIIYSCQMQNAFWHLSNLTKTQSFFKSRKYCMYSPFWILSSIGHSTSLKHKYTMFQKAIHTMYVPFDIFFCCHLTFESTFFFETAPYYTKIVELCLFSRVYKSQLFLLLQKTISTQPVSTNCHQNQHKLLMMRSPQIIIFVGCITKWSFPIECWIELSKNKAVSIL